MESPHTDPDPICAQVGHRYVSLIAWRCEHSGRIEGHVRVWVDQADETEQLLEVPFKAGPFDADIVMGQMADGVATALAALLEPL